MIAALSRKGIQSKNKNKNKKPEIVSVRMLVQTLASLNGFRF